jgi:CheY-like chemotaxis protein
MTMPDPGHDLAGHPLRILLVDDSAEGRRALAQLLAYQGYDVVEAHDGASAKAALALPIPPDIVITDLLLPDLDGRDVARLAHERSPLIRVVLITGWSMEVDPKDLTETFHQVFLKPLNSKDLFSYLKSIAYE